jgi:preprotein translocase subunit SecD
MLQYPKWKLILVLAICGLGFVLASPNIMPDSWRVKLPAFMQPVSLGLDLQGGSHLLLEVDVAAVAKEQLNALVESVRTSLRKEQIRYQDLGVESGNAVIFKVADAEMREKARGIVRKLEAGISTDTRDDGAVLLRYTEQSQIERRNSAITQSIEIVRRRIDELGTRESTIIRQGDSRILVQLPGVDDPERIKRLLGKTAKLTFHLVDYSVSLDDATVGRVPPGSQLLQSAEGGRSPAVVIKKRIELGGETLVDSQPNFQDGQPVVSFRFNAQGAKKFGAITQENTGKQFAIVLDGKVISAPVIREPILGGSGQISGSFTVQGAQDLALLLRAGALPAPLTILEERTVGPDLGADSIRAGKIASLLGLALVVVFMILFYGIFGLFANIALVINLVLLLGVLSVLGATLTLPGIAGIVLTMGMAVDANVLIYERMREEASNGRTVISAIAAGFERAFVTIVDANLTTLIAAGLLFQFGTGPVRGFAVVLAMGLLTSMFTAIMVTRLMIVQWLHVKRPTSLPV